LGFDTVLVAFPSGVAAKVGRGINVGLHRVFQVIYVMNGQSARFLIPRRPCSGYLFELLNNTRGVET